jgi:hypothetical protein
MAGLVQVMIRRLTDAVCRAKRPDQVQNLLEIPMLR